MTCLDSLPGTATTTAAATTTTSHSGTTTTHVGTTTSTTTTSTTTAAAAAGTLTHTGVNIAGFDFGCDTTGTCKAPNDPPLSSLGGGDGQGQMQHFVSKVRWRDESRLT